jgi:hypothetical protein
MTPAPSRWRKPQTWHALILAAVQVGGLTLFGWSALSLWLVFLWDDLCLAKSTWVRTAWARTKANEGWLERGIAIFGHAMLDLVTIAALVAILIVMMPWPDGETFGPVWERNFGLREFGIGAITALSLTLIQWPAWWRADRSGELPDIDAIRGDSRLLTRYWVGNVALLLGLPFLGGGDADFAATLILIGLRTAWTVWFDGRALTGKMG